MDFNQKTPAEQLARIMRRVYDRGLTTASGGNISILDENGDIWITPKGIDKGGLTEKDIVCVHPDGSFDGIHAPSSELPFHSAIYRARPDFRAVLHAHPVYSIAYSLLRVLPRVDLLPQTELLCRNKRLAKYAMMGSRKLGENMYAEFSKGADVVILENHGVCVGGADLMSACHTFENVEYAAKLELLAKRLGTPNGLSEEQAALFEDAIGSDAVAKSQNAGEDTARDELLRMIRRAYQQRLFSGSLGVASVRLADGSFLISPEGQDNAEMDRDDLAHMRGNARLGGGAPSRYAAMHAAIYGSQPDVNAIFTAQPVNVMAFAVSDAPFETYTIPESYVMLHEVPKFAFEEPISAPEQAAARLSAHTPVALFRNNCLVTTGASLFQAYDRLEVAEATAGSILTAREAGNIVLLGEQDILDLKTTFHVE